MTWTFGALLLLGAIQEPQRQPVPEAAAQKDAERFFKDLFKDEFKGRSDPEKRILSQKLYQQALELKDNPVRQFVALRQSYDVALQGGAVDRAETALQAMQERFATPVAALRLPLLAIKAKAGSELKAIAGDYLVLASEAAEEEDFETSAKAAKAAVDASKKAKEAALLSKAEALAKDVGERKMKFEGVRRAKDTLKSSPADAAANLTVGRHEAFVKGNWEAALPLLEKSSDAKLKQLAQWDLAGPTRVEDQLAVADGWWDVAEKESEPGKASGRRHAASWYGKALDAAPEARRPGIEGRLKEAGAAVSGTGKATLGPFPLDEDGAIHHWLLLGPISMDFARAMAEDLLGGEAKAAPGAGLEAAAEGGKRTWKPLASKAAKIVLMPAVWPLQENAAAYAACWIDCEAETKAVLRLGSDDGYRAWLDGEELGAAVEPRMFKWDQNSHELTMARGRHLLLLKLGTRNGGFEFGARLTTKSFEVPKGVRIWN